MKNSFKEVCQGVEKPLHIFILDPKRIVRPINSQRFSINRIVGFDELDLFDRAFIRQLCQVDISLLGNITLELPCSLRQLLPSRESFLPSLVLFLLCSVIILVVLEESNIVEDD
jgi:hypothetical protein